MADTKISALTSGNPAATGDLIPIARNVSGTETNFAVTSDSIAALAGGVFYASQFTGATVDVIVNACISAAIAAGNGICDARSLIGTQTIAATINVGNASNAPVTLLLPHYATWTTSINDGVSCAIKQYSLTNIVGGDLELRMQIRNGSPTNGLYCLYTTGTGGGYYRASGFTLYSPSVSVAGGAIMQVLSAADNSVYRNIEVLNYHGIGIRIGGSGSPCCSIGLYNVTSNCNYTGNIPLQIQGNASGTVNGVYFFGGSFDHPGIGQPNISCTDTSAAKNTTVGFFGIYEEGANGDTTTAMNQISGCGSVTVVGMEIKSETASSIAPAWSISNTKNTSFQLMGLAMLLNFTYPATAVVNNFTSQTVQTDAAGYLPQYNSGITYLNSVSVFNNLTSDQYFTQTTCFSSAHPAVCGAAAAGAVTILANDTIVTVNTTAVTANSQIILQADDTLGTNLGVTCNSTLATLTGGLAVTARTPGVSFQVTFNGTVAVNPLCLSFTVIN